MLLDRVFLILLSLVLCVDASAQDSHCLERATEGARGAVFGLGEGLAAATAVTLEPSRIERIRSAPSGQLVERRHYEKNGLVVTAIAIPGDKAILPVAVEVTTPEAIRMVSKTLAELSRGDVLPTFGPPILETALAIRYRGPAEACDEFIDLGFKGQALASVHWSFCGE